MYALFTIMPLRDSIIYINVVFLVCKDAGRPGDLARKLIMTKTTYDIIMSELRVYREDQNRKLPSRSYKGNSDCIKALLDVACRLLTTEEFRRLYAECMAW